MNNDLMRNSMKEALVHQRELNKLELRKATAEAEEAEAKRDTALIVHRYAVDHAELVRLPKMGIPS